jgi:hypothetical protein
MPALSPAMMMFLEPFKAAAAEGAVVELKLRLVAAKVPALQKYAHKKHLESIEDDLAEHFAASLSAEERETLRLCRQLRNKILHTDFRAARDKLNDLGEETQSGGVRKIDIPVVSIAAISEKIAAARAGTEGVLVGDTSSTAEGTIYGWFLEAASGDIFRKACAAFRSAAAIADRLADIENS